jgi:hypothetical protein
MAILAMAAQVGMVVEAEVAAVTAKGEAVAAVEMVPVHQVGMGITISVGSLDIGLVIAAVRSSRRRRKNRPLRPKKRSLL